MFADTLKRMRESNGLRQSDIAKKLNTSQSAYSYIESGTRVPGVDLAFRALRGAGGQVAFFPTRRLTVAQRAEAIGDALEEGRFSVAYRAFIQVADDLMNAEPAEAVGLSLTEPELLARSEWANALAALVEYSLHKRTLPVPQWTANYGAPLERPVALEFSDSLDISFPVDLQLVPPEFAKRNVLLEEPEIVSA
ncbi:helix-turn-helix domain-containing protein [Jonesia quinghaiensis]|uniref:helix-turn-helix domain-containing protein n=1 Tax=Jonesia quinghaiensis TaxID=262806 RepID=UPI000425B4DA|nr:helix-turn-helix transcriptional regulator [Jonesia quinghaiensis]